MNDPFSKAGLKSTALHESGHAVATVVLGHKFERVYIVTQGALNYGDLQGSCVRNLHGPDFAGKPESARKEAVIAVAGPMMEWMATHGTMWTPSPSDLDCKAALKFLKFAHLSFTMKGNDAHFSSTPQQDKMLSAMMNGVCNEACGLIQAHWGTIVKVADELLVKTELSFDEVALIVSQGPKTSH